MRNKERRDKLFKKHPYCHWCSRPLVDPRNYQWKTPSGHNRLIKNPPDNLATLDHLDSRFSQERGKHPGKVRTVLACQKCNLQRAADEARRLGAEALRRRTEAGHRNKHKWGLRYEESQIQKAEEA